MAREHLGSRLGFILLSAGCAIGIGNIWRFPYVVGQNGGGIFVLFYILFLAIIGIPLLCMEYAIGRGSGMSVIKAYSTLTPKKKAWNTHGVIALVGNYLLMMFYSVVSGWMAYYFLHFTAGDISDMNSEQTTQYFVSLTENPVTMLIFMIVMVLLGFLICSLGLQNGVEKITKVMMTALLVLILALAVRSLTLDGAEDGIKFYLFPDTESLSDLNIIDIIIAAMNQSFFTLSLGIGSMMIFGSYMNRKRRLLTESVTVAVLDTIVAITSGLIIFPACFAYGVEPDSGPSLVFITLPNVFNNMSGGRVWGSLFFMFMVFASLSTLVAVFENIMACCMDKFGWGRKKAALINFFIVAAGSVPCILGFNILSNFHPLGGDSGVLDLEDFIVSNVILPVGSLLMLFFCTWKRGWGYEKFIKEANKGGGLRFPKAKGVYFYLKFILPVIIAFLFITGIVNVFIK